MWVISSDGMYMPSMRPAGTYQPGEPELQVRSRRRIDLDRLRENWLPELGDTAYFGDYKTDYQYRAYCTRAQYGQALARMAEAIDYTKFKPTAKDDQLHNAMLRVWGAILNAFPSKSSYDYPPKPAPAKKPGRGRRTGYPWDRAKPTTDRPAPQGATVPLFSDEEWDDALRTADSNRRRFPY